MHGISWDVVSHFGRLIHENILGILNGEYNLLKHVWFVVGAGLPMNSNG